MGMKSNFSCLEFFQRSYEKQGQACSFQAKSPQEAGRWRKPFQRRLEDLLGISQMADLMEHKSPFFMMVSQVQEDGYLRAKYFMETLPGVIMPFYILVPDGQKPFPAAICFPGHGANKDSVAGVRTDPAVRMKLKAHPEEAYGQALARQGFVVFCPDPPGYGERREPCSGGAKDPLGTSCRELAPAAESLGLTLIGITLWEQMLLLDLMDIFSMVDQRRIACVGFSGGGMYSMWLTAMEDRIAAAVVSGYVHGFKDCILSSHLCPCNFVPGLWNVADLSDICSLIAPRPFYVENGRQDPLSGPMGIAGPTKQTERIREAYRAYGREENFRFETPKGGHQWYGGGIPFLVEALGNRR